MIIGSLQRPELLDTPEFRREMVALITGYLKAH
jgi:hypothetical protein